MPDILDPNAQTITVGTTLYVPTDVGWQKATVTEITDADPPAVKYERQDGIAGEARTAPLDGGAFLCGGVEVKTWAD